MDKPQVLVVVEDGHVQEIYSTDPIGITVINKGTHDETERAQIKAAYDRVCMDVYNGKAMRIY